MKKYLQTVLSAIFFIAVLSINSLAQDSLAVDYNKPDRKGKMYVHWGWNVSSYSNSDISFRGNDYNFTLSDVVAKDSQTPWDASVYLNPVSITNPQTNFKFGYFINDHYAINVGVDHMKYVMQQDNTVKINGEISNGTIYDGVYNNADIILSKEFLRFEHTDGLNYINVEIERLDDLLKITGNGKKNLEINTVVGAGVGALLPKTNATLMDFERNDEFHLAGYGLDVKIGLDITFYKYFFVRGELKGGFIHMPDIRTTRFKADKASQAFFFGEADFLFGAIFRISNK